MACKMIPDAFFTFSYSESSFQEMLPDAYLDFETETKNTVFIFIFIFEKQKQKRPFKNVTGRALNDSIFFPKNLINDSISIDMFQLFRRDHII